MLYGCEMWFVTLRGESLKEPKINIWTQNEKGELRKLHKVEFHDLHHKPKIVSVINI